MNVSKPLVCKHYTGRLFFISSRTFCDVVVKYVCVQETAWSHLCKHTPFSHGLLSRRQKFSFSETFQTRCNCHTIDHTNVIALLIIFGCPVWINGDDGGDGNCDKVSQVSSVRVVSKACLTSYRYRAFKPSGRVIITHTRKTWKPPLQIFQPLTAS